MGLTQGARGFGNGLTGSLGAGLRCTQPLLFLSLRSEGSLVAHPNSPSSKGERDAPKTSRPWSTPSFLGQAVTHCGTPRVALLEGERLNECSLQTCEVCLCWVQGEGTVLWGISAPFPPPSHSWPGSPLGPRCSGELAACSGSSPRMYLDAY